MNKLTWATPFSIDTALVGLGCLAGSIAAFGAGFSIWQVILGGGAGFFITALFMGILHRHGVSPGQLIFPGTHRCSGRSTALHVAIFTSSVAMTGAFMIGCAAVVLIRRLVSDSQVRVLQPR